MDSGALFVKDVGDDEKRERSGGRGRRGGSREGKSRSLFILVWIENYIVYNN